MVKIAYEPHVRGLYHSEKINVECQYLPWKQKLVKKRSFQKIFEPMTNERSHLHCEAPRSQLWGSWCREGDLSELGCYENGGMLRSMNLLIYGIWGGHSMMIFPTNRAWIAELQSASCKASHPHFDPPLRCYPTTCTTDISPAFRLRTAFDCARRFVSCSAMHNSESTDRHE